MTQKTAAAQDGPTAAMLVIGDEILSGRTRDSNAHHLAGALTEKGVRLREIRVVADDHDGIVAAVRALSNAYDLVFTSGGIGPTHDDITADAVAAAFGRSIGVRDDARAILEAYYGSEEINDARLRMARIPDGAALIDNPISRAPGFRLENVHVMAGVPIIFQEMARTALSEIDGGAPERAWSFRAQVPEGEIAADLGAIAAAAPNVSIGVYPFYRGGLGSTVVLRATDLGALAETADIVRAALAAHGGALAETPPET